MVRLSTNNLKSLENVVNSDGYPHKYVFFNLKFLSGHFGAGTDHIPPGMIWLRENGGKAAELLTNV